MRTALCLVLGLAAGTAVAADQRSFGPFSADTVELEDFSGELEVAVVDRPAIEIRLSATAEDIAAFAATSDGSRLRLRGPQRTQGSATVVVGGVRVFSRGGEASVVIGGQPADRQAPVPRLSLALPRGTALELSGIAGEVHVGDTEAPFALALVSGRATVGSVAAARIALSGSGEVQVQAVRERLDAAIDGSGSIVVASGEVERASLVVRGAGDIRFGGTARQARAEIAGAGTIVIHAVHEPPEVSVSGAGRVDIERHP
ncbi:hypothetical protein HRbin40_01417 [bacterium HR40]|nr:hypothetical protein HRbin40_01417 [bacterium HR40]